ncbi:UDP-glycosyltransferase 75C1-like [Corylus avellana]|uniref:UDP-glycosyltransferase 75C1-like n=1 Tax=Corylus avellana TaxID=13451 RepID=UPI00286C006E|nr:UDP-glycosyltransferase 75C1-like [Corylus avellana]
MNVSKFEQPEPFAQSSYSRYTIMVRPHFLLITYPIQGHINPGLQFSKRLIRLGAHVTFVTTVAARRRMAKTPDPDGLSFSTFSDGYDDGFKDNDGDLGKYMSEIRRRSSQALTDLVVSSANEGRPFTGLVYTILLPWAGDVANEFHLPSALLWIQPAMVFDIYYYFFNGYGDVIRNSSNDPSCPIQLPGLPLLTSRDLPSFLLASSTQTFMLPALQEQLEALEKESKPIILVNTFDALELEALRAIEKFNLIGIGPLTPSAFLDGKDPSDTSSGGDLFQSSKDYMEWLNSKPKSSVVYVSFGSLLVLSKQQMEEIARGLLDSGRPFLWVIKAKENGEEEKEDNKLSCMEELEENGKIVPWCSQLEVLSHPSLGCFVTHCGWNSTLESLSCGVPVVAFPHWSDQGTNAKLIEDMWKTGVRVAANEDGIVGGDEIKRCLELILGGGRGEDIRKNAMKWKALAAEAAKEGGSSYNNLKAFVDEIAQGGC